ncbi:hypothetical protein K505DRAFT_370009 [Melanomma pulvis-pyrius CBS 109.77]|uniref:Uncharacterized protein n=1 Tax=Melanomma pulvis-pyrius CBS 109.77 TaxID=1314802 RepID=A0A6A6XX44_9PLEO|nr:hypothetical protein K505DRAFT_370009 [Melanomma pulvis-pyrius CBS 109.77]
MVGAGIMKVILLLSWLSLAFAASESSSSSSSSRSLRSSSFTSNSTSSSSTSTGQSSSSGSSIVGSSLSSSSSVQLSSSTSSTAPISSPQSVGSLTSGGLGATVTTSSVSSTSGLGSASASASLNVLAVSTIIGNTPIANSTATPTPTGPVSYVNPWAGNFSAPVPFTGTGSDYALQCQNAYFSFTSINSDFITATASLFNITSVIRSTTVYEVHTYYTTSFYTLCDGHPRVITSMPTSTATTVLLPSTTVILAQGVSWASLNDPNCTVSWDDCSGLWSRYASASSVYQSVSFEKANTVVSLGPGASFWVVNGETTTFPTPLPFTISLADEYIHRSPPGSNYIIVTTPPPGGLFIDDGYHMTANGAPVTIQHTVNFTNTPYTPHCRTEKPTCTANQRCQIGGDRVEVFYFPPKTNVTRDMCATAPVGNGVISRPPTNFTWTEITTGPYTVLPGGTTWYSGNVYVSLNRISAQCTWSGVPVEVGAEHAGEILTMAPSELFSQRAFPITTGSHSGMFDFEPYAYSFNFADLAEPYPWSAWNGAPECVIDHCSIINGSYNPWLAVPEAIRRLDPSWATCDLALYGLYDPPRALTSVGNIFATLTSTVPKQEPTPGQPAQSQVQPTKTPDPPAPGQSDAPNPPNDPPVDPPQPPAPGQSAIPVPVDPPNTPIPVDPPTNNPPSNNPPTNNPPSNNPPSNNPHPNNPTNPNDPNKPPPNEPNNPGITPGPVPIPPAPAPTTIATIGGTPIVLNPSDPTHIIVGTTTLAPGSPGITVGAGTSISMVDPGHIIVSAPGAPAPSTINVPQPVAAVPTQGVVVTLPNGELITATAISGPSGSSIIVSGTLLTEGGPAVTLPNGVVLSEAPGATGIVVVDPISGATSTIPFSGITNLLPTPRPTPGAVITIGGKTYTVVSTSGSIVIPGLGVTLTQGGPATTINGTVVSDAGTGVVVGTTTNPFSTLTVTDQPGTVQSGPAEFTGAAARIRAREVLGEGWWCWFGGWMLGVLLLGVRGMVL